MEKINLNGVRERWRFAICLLDYVCWSKSQNRGAQLKYLLRGERKSPAKTLDNGLGKFLNWMEDMFGPGKDGQMCRLNEFIRRLNPEKRINDLPFELEIRDRYFSRLVNFGFPGRC